jgi:hypothetical protein
MPFPSANASPGPLLTGHASTNSNRKAKSLRGAGDRPVTRKHCLDGHCWAVQLTSLLPLSAVTQDKVSCKPVARL